MEKHISYEVLEDEEVSEETYALIEKKTEEAERDIEKEHINVNFRWGRGQLEIVKQAAKTMGVPYQTYIKQVIFRQSLQDLQEAKNVLKQA